MPAAKKNKKYGNIHGGFTMLYAILLTVVVLSIGLSLLEVLVQQVSITGTARESLLSFSAADSGMECALYADKIDVFRQGGTAALPVTCSNTSFFCNGSSITASKETPPSVPFSPSETVWTCKFEATLPAGTCAKVIIHKITDNITGDLSTTTIESRGYNTICPPALSLKPWRLERALQTVY